MKKYILVFLTLFLSVGGFIIAWQGSYFNKVARSILLLPNKQMASVAAVVSSPFYYTFKIDGILDEAGKMNNSSSPYFWLNSGGLFYLKNGIGKTIQGELSQFNKWRLAYAISNPIDTDNGYYPQNIFRLVTRSKWQNFSQEAYFKITKMNMSASVNRDVSNGILLFNRYQDGNNLYYAGIRVDGQAVVKKKINGDYYPIGISPVFKGEDNRQSNPNLLPENVWLGLRSEITTNGNEVMIKLFIDKENNGEWQLALEAKDDGKSYGGAAILDEGHAGIRTDFMDAEFDNYRIVDN